MHGVDREGTMNVHINLQGHYHTDPATKHNHEVHQRFARYTQAHCKAEQQMHVLGTANLLAAVLCIMLQFQSYMLFVQAPCARKQKVVNMIQLLVILQIRTVFQPATIEAFYTFFSDPLILRELSLVMHANHIYCSTNSHSLVIKQIILAQNCKVVNLENG